jgi:ribonuclease PH
MMRNFNQQFYSLKDFRSDGRKRDEIRDIGIAVGFDRNYDGSSRFKIGLTEIECRVQGPIGVTFLF